MNKNLIFAHICDQGFLTQEGKPCFIGIFKKIKTPTLPFTYPKMCCAMSFNTTKKNNKIVVQILKKKDREILSRLEGIIHNENADTGKEAEVLFFSDFINTKFDSPGEHEMEIWINDEIAGQIPFFIEIVAKK